MELEWLAAACGHRMWRWGGGPGAARPTSDGSAGVVSGESRRRVWDRDGRPRLEIGLGGFVFFSQSFLFHTAPIPKVRH